MPFRSSIQARIGARCPPNRVRRVPGRGFRRPRPYESCRGGGAALRRAAPARPSDRPPRPVRDRHAPPRSRESRQARRSARALHDEPAGLAGEEELVVGHQAGKTSRGPPPFESSKASELLPEPEAPVTMTPAPATTRPVACMFTGACPDSRHSYFSAGRVTTKRAPRTSPGFVPGCSPPSACRHGPRRSAG
jgi:hypothetical protein